MIELEATEVDLAHPCTDISLYTPDLDLLAYMLQDLRSLIRSSDAGKVELVAHEPTFWHVHGLRRRTVVCEPALIRRADRVCIVGFFAARRESIDYPSLDELEMNLLLEFRNFPGILSYSSVELVDNQWANLVVHMAPDDREQWRQSAVHVHAVDELAPVVYHNVRIHNGCLPGGVRGIETIVIESTKYWDLSLIHI